MAKITIEIPDHLIPSYLKPKEVLVLEDNKLSKEKNPALIIALFQSETDQDSTEDNPFPDVEMKIIGIDLKERYFSRSYVAKEFGIIPIKRVFESLVTVQKYLENTMLNSRAL